MLAGSWCWKNYKSFFEQKNYHCYTPTLRFHHFPFNSIPPLQLGTTSILDYVNDLEKEIQQLDSLPILIGHSMGGLIAQILGSRGLAKALVLITPASPYGILNLRLSVIKNFLSLLSQWGFWKKPFCETFSEFAYSAHLLSVEQQQNIYNRLVWESGQAAVEIGLSMFYRNSPTKVDESKVTCPVLVIGAKHDTVTPPVMVKKIAKKYHTVSTYKEFSNHGHTILAEDSLLEVTKYISNWLLNPSERSMGYM